MLSIENAALVVVDMQNDFVRVGAPFEVPLARATIGPIQQLIALFRSLDKPIVFTRYVGDGRYLPLKPQVRWLSLIEPPVEACVPGIRRSYADSDHPLEGFAIIDELAPLDGDRIVDKPFYSAFHETDLHAWLQDRQVRTLAIVGTATEMCVEDTARHAVHFGYFTALVADAVSSSDASAHDACLTGFGRNYGWIVTVPDLIALLSRQSAIS